MTTADNRLLTAEQLDCDLQAVYHLGVAYQGGDAMRRIERHIAALTEQITAYKSGHDDDSAMIHMQEEEEEKIITMANHIAAQAEQIARQAVPTDSVTGEQMAELSHAEHEAREALIKASHAYYVSSGERLAQMILHGEDGRTKLAKQRRRKARTIVEAMDEAARNFVVALDRADAARTIRRHGVEVARRQA